MNRDIILKLIAPSVKDNKLTYNEFSRIFAFLSKREQYEVVNILEDNCIELVDYILPDFDNLNIEEFENSEYAIENISTDEEIEDDEILYDGSVFKDIKTFDSIDSYQTTYNKITQSNEILCRLIQRGNQQAKQDLCIKNKNLVMKYVFAYGKYYNSGLDEDDLMQAGYLGLIKAAERFDHSMENAFSTYAVHWIRQSVTREIMDTGFLIRIPVHKFEQINKVGKIERSLLNDIDSFSSRVNQIATTMEISEKDVEDCFILRNNFIRYSSLNVLVGDDDSTELGQFVPDNQSNSLEDIVMFNSLTNLIDNVLDTITQKEKDILVLRFGLEDGQQRTLEEVGKVYHVTRERIRQIEAKALRKLRHPSRSKKLKDYLYI